MAVASPLSISVSNDVDQFVSGDGDGFELEPSRVVKVESEEAWEQFLKEANAQSAIVVAHFSAEWCAPCKFMEPAFNNMSKRLSHVIFLEVDMDVQHELASKLQVKALPTFLFIKDEAVIDKIVGANPEELEKKIETLASPC
ncbi:hypothetical protein SELMODRAFT_159524 [Selaginella moellendorffii]|uniref:Thioredoxin domain-containing protein n=1 Tax=Selaginella moellendorffii TaxID=88036 RepID=D8SYT6_SELML|nr:thioredoxin-like protein CXXS1 [Selaginella moellendorffii]EFJ10295.1 hypothetical protein SELMODRAFT_159524 [Selaginella moellendorffii]|eukprot:XP_002988499.1 thioredoxin-like protein CXXS1 [Selaginella moellendorffii]